MKLKNWLDVMLYTRTIEGPFYYFQISYFAHTVLTVLERVKFPKSAFLRKNFGKVFSKEIIIKNRIGTFSVNPKNDSLTKSITSFELRHQDWLKNDCSKNIFIDIGANIGFYSIISTTKYGYNKAYAFEPNPETFKRLKKNVELNNLTDKIKLLSFGLSDTNEAALLGTKSVHTGSSTFLTTSGSGITAIEVQTKTFDDFTIENNIDPRDISFIKIDVEGYEYKVLKGMTATLDKVQSGTAIFIEIHPKDAQAVEKRALLVSNSFECLKSSSQNNYLYIKK